LSALNGLLDDIRADAAAAASGGPQPPGTPSPYRRLFGHRALLQSPATGELIGQLAELENQLTGMLMTLTPADRDVGLLLDRIAVVEAQLQATAETYVESLERQVEAFDGILAGFQDQ